MPVDPAKKTPLKIQEIPPDSTRSPEQLGDLMNDRIRQINAALKLYVTNPAIGDVDLGTSQIHNLADPKDDLDGVNLRTLKRFGAVGVPEGTGKGSGLEQPTIYFTFDGLPFDGEESPYAPIMANRDGFAPTAVVASAVGVPTSADCEVNLQIAGVDMLPATLHIPLSDNGPVFTTSFALAAALRKGTLIKAVIVVAGGATQVTIGLSLRGGN